MGALYFDQWQNPQCSFKYIEQCISKLKSSILSQIFKETMPFVIGMSRSKTGLMYQYSLLYLTEVINKHGL